MKSTGLPETPNTRPKFSVRNSPAGKWTRLSGDYSRTPARKRRHSSTQGIISHSGLGHRAISENWSLRSSRVFEPLRRVSSLPTTSSLSLLIGDTQPCGSRRRTVCIQPCWKSHIHGLRPRSMLSLLSCRQMEQAQIWPIIHSAIVPVWSSP